MTLHSALHETWQVAGAGYPGGNYGSDRLRTVGPSGCDYTTIDGAIAYFVTAVAGGLAPSETQPLVILLHPGYYAISKGSNSYGIDLSGATSADGGGGTLSHVHLVGLDRDTCVIDFTSIGTVTTSPRAIDAALKSRVANVTLINDQATRFVHWDSAGSGNYGIFENIKYVTTNGKSAISAGIRGAQRLIARNSHVEGAADFTCHGSSSGAGTALVIFDRISSDGSVASGKTSGINLDGQIVNPAHDLTAIISDINFPEPLDITAGQIGLVIKHPTNGAKWVYKTDGSLRINQSGTADTSFWNSFHFPQPKHYTGAAGVALQEGDVAVWDVTNQKLTTTITKGDLWPVIIARPVGTDNVNTRSPIICTGPYAYVPIVTADAVSIGDTIVTSTTARSATVDNTVILTNKIIGWSEEAKSGGIAGRVKVRINKAWIG